MLLLSLAGCGTTGIPFLSQTGLNDSAAAKSATNQNAVAAVANAPAATAGKDDSAAVQVSEFGLDDSRAVGELRFESGDSVKVSVWGYPELDHTTTIQPNGKITLPLAGEVDAARTSAAELRQRIIDKLEPFSKAASSELRAGDSLAVEVWQHVELRHTAVIDPSGWVTFPLAGRFPAAGRPVEELRREVEKRLLEHLRDARVTLLPIYNNRRVLHDRHVSVLAQTLQPRRVALIGEVGVPGMTEIRGSLRLVEALAQAQMREKTVDLNSIIVIRNPEGRSPQYRMIRLADYFEGRAPDQNIFLQHHDIVVVPRTAIAKAGDFVEQFFSRTAPIFTWWSAMFQASVARDSADTTRLINESLTRSLNALTVSPVVR